MRYPELAAFDSTADQDLGLTIQFKDDTDTRTATPGAYLALILSSVLDGYAARHVGQIKKARVNDAFDKATDQEKQQVATILKISLTVEPPTAVDADAVPLSISRTSVNAVSAPVVASTADTATTAAEPPAAPETWSQWTSRMLGLQ